MSEEAAAPVAAVSDGGGDTGYVGSDGTFNEGWTSREEFKGDAATLERFKNVPDLAKSYISARNKLGKNPDSLIEIPNDTSSDEVKAAWRTAKGVPENLEGYEYNLSDDHAVKLGPLDDGKMAAFREFANSQDLSPSQFKAALDFYHTNMAGDIDAGGVAFNEKQTADSAAAKVELQKLPGWQTEAEYTAKIEIAQSVLDKYGLAAGIEDLGLQNSPQMIEGLNNIANAMSEDTLKGLKGDTGISAENINSQIAEIRNQQAAIREKDNVNFKSNPAFKELENRLKGLYQKKPA